MLHFRRVQREDHEVVQIACNKCGKAYPTNDLHPSFTAIKHTYGYGSRKDGDKYVSHVCESCMDEFYATFTVPPQVVSTIVWGEEPPDPVRYLGEPEPPYDPMLSSWPVVTSPDSPATPVAPAGEDHASQEEAS